MVAATKRGNRKDGSRLGCGCIHLGKGLKIGHPRDRGLEIGFSILEWGLPGPRRGYTDSIDGEESGQAAFREPNPTALLEKKRTRGQLSWLEGISECGGRLG